MFNSNLLCTHTSLSALDWKIITSAFIMLVKTIHVFQDFAIKEYCHDQLCGVRVLIKNCNDFCKIKVRKNGDSLVAMMAVYI